jgi:hypothetical protein
MTPLVNAIKDATFIQNQTEDLKDAALSLFIGECIGTGAYRHVYEIKGQDHAVLKIEHDQRFNNVMEWTVWESVRGTDNAKWFAPCLEISDSGRALIQARTEVFDEDGFREAVTSVPAFFDDIHFGNWGMLDGRPVCHDYAFNYLLEYAAKSKRMKTVRHPPSLITHMPE